MPVKAHKCLPAGRQGFTLIELIVAVSITLFLTGMIIVNYGSYNATQALKQSALTLKNDLRFAQSKALAGEKPASPVVCSQLIGYTVSFTSNTYTIQAECNPEGLQGVIKSVSVSGGVVFNPVPSSLTFFVLSRGTSLTSVQTIRLSGTGKFYSMTIQPGGDISDLGLQ